MKLKQVYHQKYPLVYDSTTKLSSSVSIVLANINELVVHLNIQVSQGSVATF